MIAAERKTLCIAIDGPAGAGKSTVARRVADALDYTYIDTGAMYRALAWAVLQSGIPATDNEAVSALAERLDVRLEPGRVWVGGQDITLQIRTPEISNLTSPLSALPRVRARMVALQQAMARRGGVVMEGRDIGTVVLPEAEVKVFLTASQDERVRRRQEELAARGMTLPAERIADGHRGAGRPGCGPRCRADGSRARCRHSGQRPFDGGRGHGKNLGPAPGGGAAPCPINPIKPGQAKSCRTSFRRTTNTPAPMPSRA